MSNVTKKVIRVWDGGIKTSKRSSDPKTSDGAQMTNHFDVFTDPNRLIPMPSWTPFTTTAEKAYGIKAIGGYDDTVYGIGKALTNWYGRSWGFRVQVTADLTKYLGGSIPLRINLADMPATFWSNVNSDGSDIRVTNENHTTLASKVEGFNTATQVGSLWIEANFTSSVYIYYGNSDATAIPTNTNGVNYRNSSTDAFSGSNMGFSYNFDNNKSSNTNSPSAFVATPNYVAGSFGKAIYTPSELITSVNDGIYLGGSDISVSFMIYLNSVPTTTLKILGDNNNSWSISVTNTPRIEWSVRGATGGSATKTSGTNLNLNQWYVIDCTFDSSYNIAVNGVVQNFPDTRGNFAPILSNSTFNVNSQGFCYLANIWGFNDDLDQAKITTKYNNLTNASTFWSFGTQTAYDSSSAQFSGTQVWQKSITSGDWEEFIQSGQPARVLDKYPVNGFVEYQDDVYFIISQNEDGSGFYWLAKTDTYLGIDDTYLQLSISPNGSTIRPTSESRYTGSPYFTYEYSRIGQLGNPSVANIFTSPDSIVSMSAWRNFLALGYTRRTRSAVLIWDGIAADPQEFVDAGTGNLRIVGNASDLLFSVVDNYIDSEVLSSGEPTMEIRQYVGNGRMDSVVRVPASRIFTGWEHPWERAVSFFKIRRGNETLFYAKIPTGETGFNEGFWAVGKNTRGQLALTLMVDTSEFGTPENVHGFAQQIFFVEHDGGIQRLGSTYDKTSSHNTLLMNEGNSEIEKKLIGIEVITEPLEVGQEISVYYKKIAEDGNDADRTLIATFSGEGKVAFESVDSPEDDGYINLGNYQEVEFWVESTGGKSAITEFSYKYEYTSELV